MVKLKDYAWGYGITLDTDYWLLGGVGSQSGTYRLRHSLRYKHRVDIIKSNYLVPPPAVVVDYLVRPAGSAAVVDPRQGS